MITKDNGSFTVSVFRKDKYTGLGLNYDSFVPNTFKINSIKTLLHRTYNICSTWHYFHSELEKLRKFFSINGCPSNFDIKKTLRDLLIKNLLRITLALMIKRK